MRDFVIVVAGLIGAAILAASFGVYHQDQRARRRIAEGMSAAGRTDLNPPAREGEGDLP